ncbi:MAG: ABC transporter permease [Anaerolineae bacterium]|nr:ABC transporter permease [Anaerolineae bacterium]
MSLQAYILRRFLFVIPLLVGITLVAFLIANAVPADPINANLPQNALNDEAVVQAFREKWGLDKPLAEQYLTYLGNLLQGDLGTSIKTRKPVINDIQQFLPATIELSTFSIMIGLAMGVGVGIVSAVWKNTWIDYLARAFVVLGVSFPVFVLALIGLTVLHVHLGIVAGPGRLDFIVRDPPHVSGLFLLDSALAGQWDKFGNALSHLVLPSVILGSYVAGIIARITRSSLLEVLGMDYIRTARSKGVKERWVIIRHGLSNAMIPVVTIIGISYGNLLVGSVLIESIFAWPGIGRYAFRASTSQDFPAIMGVSILIAFIYVAVNFIVDILYYFLDPRIRVA